MQVPKIEWRPYLDMSLRRKWWIILPFFMVLVSGGLYFHLSPKTYTASTLILVEAQRVPREFVPSTVTVDLQSRLQTISQQVHSRTNLEEIIERFELYPPHNETAPDSIAGLKRKILTTAGIRRASGYHQDQESPSMQQLVQNVRNRIGINLRGRNQAFEISFEWWDAETAAQVANALASQFIDRNLKVREEMAMGTTSFLDAEVQRLQQQLQEREIALENFKKENMGSLPSQLSSNLSILEQLKEEKGRVEERAEQARHQLTLMEKESLIQARNQLAGSDLLLAEPNPRHSEIDQLKQVLSEMSSRYTQQHPEIQRLNRRLARLEYEKQQEKVHEPVVVHDPEIFEPNMTRVQQEQMQGRIVTYERRKRTLDSQIRAYEQRIEQTSGVELELMNLERDYNAVNDRFQGLLRRKLDAELAEQMERRQQGEQFRVVDPAIAPDRPSSPNGKRIAFLTLILGLGVGGSLAYLRESMDPAFYTASEVEQALHPNMLISLPLVKKDKKSRKAGRG